MEKQSFEDIEDLEVVDEEEVKYPFSICPKHGYLGGDHESCPYCKQEG